VGRTTLKVLPGGSIRCCALISLLISLLLLLPQEVSRVHHAQGAARWQPPSLS
jgi:hypothetical protein